MNTLNVSAGPGLAATRLVVVPAPAGFPLLAAFKLGVDSDWADVPGVRISAQLQVCAQAPASPTDPPSSSSEVIGHFLYRSPGRALQGDLERLPAPYEIEHGEALCLYIKLTNDSDGEDTVTARANVSAWFVSGEEAS